MAQNPLFIMLPFSVDNPSLPVIPLTQIEPLAPGEPAAWDHWIFGAGETTLTGRVNNHVLTPQGSRAWAPNYVTIPMATGNALVSSKTESATVADTLCCVARIPGALPSGSAVIMGSLGDAVSPNTGGGLFASGSALSQNHRGLSGVITNTGLTLAADIWMFLAVARDFSGASKTTRVLLGGSPLVENGGISGAYNNSAGYQAFGDAYLTTATTAHLDLAEAAIYVGAMSGADMALAYARAKERQAARGIAVL
ncbi:MULTISPECIES: hypothetical protein [Methylosinus]|uniref:Uncharacterized protein n=1 Tax=Methylosinus trichosporium (strain ATCC 35070 / NCIMB 11131 / UNIQEM 75 / OB3b) TaxID=595536 RepID=A0A2D2CYA0_METT3|nr:MULTISPECIES: hypothetical protein [Methylosinus]ATQ67723.1 hypothetical protein CQW49_07335 [Methylosinus trichosporium OB3b]OBS51169.1 hypothetical protein A8B73_17775 [Methylosinus sp. 3S-1]